LAALGPGRPLGGGMGISRKFTVWGAWGPLAEGREGALPSKFEPP
jgi:hypothetical protein